MDSGWQVLNEYATRCTKCDIFDFRDWYFFTPGNSDIRVQAELMLAGKLDVAWLSFSGTWVAPVTIGLSLLLALAGLVLIRSALRAQTVDQEPSAESCPLVVRLRDAD
jgi:hypothetical protein